MAMNSIFSEPYPIVHYPSASEYPPSSGARSYSELSPEFYSYQTATAHVGSTTAQLESQLASYNQPYANYYPHYQQSIHNIANAPLSIGNCTVTELSPGEISKDHGSPPLQIDCKDGNPTYDWMKIRRNPPKTTRKFEQIYFLGPQFFCIF